MQNLKQTVIPTFKAEKAFQKGSFARRVTEKPEPDTEEKSLVLKSDESLDSVGSPVAFKQNIDALSRKHKI